MDELHDLFIYIKGSLIKWLASLGCSWLEFWMPHVENATKETKQANARRQDPDACGSAAEQFEEGYDAGLGHQASLANLALAEIQKILEGGEK